MSKFVQHGFMWKCSKRIHRDFSTEGEALNVAVQLVERRPRDVQGAKCGVNVKARNRRNIMEAVQHFGG